MRLPGLVLVLVLFSGNSWSQVISGTWKGKCMFQKEEVRIKITFAEIENSIKGESYLQFGNNRFYRFAVEGLYNSSDSTLLLKEVKLLERKKESARDNCLTTYLLGIHRAGHGFILPDNDGCHGNTKIEMISESSYYEFDRVSRNKKEEWQPPSTAGPDSMAVFFAAALQRTENVIGSFNVDQEKINIYLYDNGEVDGDTVSLFFNEEVIAYRVGLNETAIQYELMMDKKRTKNKLLFVAHNLGRIPPNTGAMRIAIGGKIYRQFISADFEKNAVLEFIPGKGQ